jgi:lipid-binding SYLF domain-containing protein
MVLGAPFLGPTADAQSSASSSASSSSSKPLTAQAVTDVAVEAQTRIDDAVPVIEKIKALPDVKELLGKAQGIVVVPHYMQAALVFGGRGGAGVLLVRRGARWSDPAFYKISGGTFGVQIGGSKGALVMLLMSDKAVDAFENKPSTWSMNAGAALTTTSYSRETPESGTLSDVIVWSDMKGLFGGAAVGASKVNRDMTANQVYYNNKDVTVQQILSGVATNPHAKALVDAVGFEEPAKKKVTKPAPSR